MDRETSFSMATSCSSEQRRLDAMYEQGGLHYKLPDLPPAGL